MITRIAGMAICLAMVLGCAGGPRTVTDRIEVGDKAPEFVLSSLFGTETINLPRLVHASNATVIVIWSMACPNCQEALLDVQKVYEQYGSKGMTFIGVNVDIENIQGVKAFLKAEGIGFTAVWDGSARVARDYRALDYTFSVFVADRDGRVILAQYDHPPDLGARLAATLDKVLAAL